MNMQSIWLDTVSFSSFAPLDGDLKTDVLVIGGGLCGLLCAHMLKEAGISYALIEANEIARGVSGHTTAKLTVQHGMIYDRLIRTFGAEKARMYAQANSEALARFRQLCAQIDCDFEMKDNYVYATDRRVMLEREWEAMVRVGLNADYVDSLPLPLPVTGAVRLRDQAQFHPLKFAAALSRGLNIYEHTAAQAYDGRSVVTDRGRITAKKIIVATHFPLFNKHGSYFLKLYQDRSYVLALEGAQQAEGMYVDAQADGLSFRDHGDLLLLTGGAHRTGRQGAGWQALHAFAAKHYPGAKVTARWATQDCMTLDGVPYIGPYSKRTPDLFVAAGFNKWGMTSSMAAAALLCDLVQGKKNDYAPLFSPLRSMLHRQLLVNGAQSAAHLLLPARPRCPHMGCALSWNAQERSWDCPCHGSRFSEDGKLLDNPAAGNLKTPR